MAIRVIPKKVIKGTATGQCKNCNQETELEFELEQSKILENEDFIRDMIRKEIDRATTCRKCGKKIWQSPGPECSNIALSS